MRAKGVKKDPLPSRLHTTARGENMPTTITWGGNVTQVTQIAWPGVSHSFVGVNRCGRVKLPAPPAIRVASAAHQLDEVRDKEGRDLSTPGKMS